MITPEKSDVLVSISGGRTSGYMAHYLHTHQRELAEFLGTQEVVLHFVFANTGMEHNDTLRFLAELDKAFGFGVVWVEGVPQQGRVGTKHRVVTPETAMRNDDWRNKEHPYHAFIRKYGIPNVAFPACTREMKRNTITSYMKSLGFRGMKDYYTAIGIREDERRRVSARAGVENIIYPLVDIEPTDKEDVLEWWKQWPFDLRIPEWQGNCICCFKKSYKKLKKVWEEGDNGAFAFCKEMERLYPRLGPEFKKEDGADRPNRVFFRQQTSTEALLDSFTWTAGATNYIDVMNDAGCSESCELYEMDE